WSVPAVTKPLVEATFSLPPFVKDCVPATVVLAPCVGLFEFVVEFFDESELFAFGSSPFGLAFASVGALLSVSAVRVSFLASTGVVSLLSTYASESVTKTAIATPARGPRASASPLGLALVLTLEVIETLPPVLLIELVPESWLLPSASTKVAATAASLSLASLQCPVRRLVSSFGWVVLAATSEVAA